MIFRPEGLRVLQEAVTPGISISYVPRQHGISRFLLFHWKRRLAESCNEEIKVDEGVGVSSQVKTLKKHIR
jgi:transposase